MKAGVRLIFEALCISELDERASEILLLKLPVLHKLAYVTRKPWNLLKGKWGCKPKMFKKANSQHRLPLCEMCVLWQLRRLVLLRAGILLRWVYMDVEEQVFPCWEKAGCQSARDRCAAPALVPVANTLGEDPQPFFLGMFPACPESCRWLQMEAGVRAAVLTRLLRSRGRISLAGFSRGSLARGIFNKLPSSSWQRTAVFKVAYRERRSRTLILIFWEHPLVQLTYFSSVYF